jgi:chromosome segregation ATPase
MVMALINQVQEWRYNMTTTTAQPVTNEDILKALQKISHALDELRSEVSETNARISEVSSRVIVMRTKLQSHDVHLREIGNLARQMVDEHSAYKVDIDEILDRVTMLEERLPAITEAELRELQTLLQALADWAIKTAGAVEVPLQLPI